jgi:hypothetical protein
MNSVPWNVIKHKVGRLHLADEIGSVSRVCKLAVFSRNTCYYYQSAMAIGSVDALIDANRHQPNLCNRVDVITETLGDAKALREQLHVHSSIMWPHQGLGAPMVRQSSNPDFFRWSTSNKILLQTFANPK